MPSAEWSALIADDEPAARRGVRQLLAAFPEFAVVAECRDGAEVLASLDRVRPDVVFLDVQMPGIDGFDVIRRRTAERMPAVVFLTAYDQFALRAFEAQALDYLVKPVTEARFAATMHRLTRQLRAAATSAREQAIVVRTAKGVTVLPLREIDWIEAADNYARIWTNGRGYLLREPLRVLEKRVQTQGFVRAHRRALIRLGAVRKLTWTDAGELVAVLSTGPGIPISRRRRAAFAAAVRAQG
ncbi:MAG TPA: LytTR family DNA-binding domain-containing protein [Gemmatimonadaceae bacterium]|nr:LytTR family DNA-binding domain-containing protein [Gemmatimonadaceae bacterium]